jgi:hypothetical protein
MDSNFAQFREAAIRSVRGTLSDARPEVLVVDLGDLFSYRFYWIPNP